VNLMLRFRLEREGVRMKCCRKMKWRQRARLDLMGRSMTRRGGVATLAEEKLHWGGERMTPVGLT
jgi:hypothetical protein